MAIGSQEAVQKRSMGVPAPDDASLGKLRLVMGLT